MTLVYPGIVILREFPSYDIAQGLIGKIRFYGSQSMSFSFPIGTDYLDIFIILFHKWLNHVQ